MEEFVSLEVVKNDYNKSDEFKDVREFMRGRSGAITLGGSHLYGTQTPDSDVDLRGFFFEDAMDFLNQSKTKGKDFSASDTNLFPFNHFVHLLSQGNCTALEVLFTPEEMVLVGDRKFAELRENKDLFLSRRLFNTFTGYARGMVAEADRRRESVKEDDTLVDYERKVTNACKSMAHAFRVLYALEGFYNSSTLNFRLSESEKHFYHTVRNGDYLDSETDMFVDEVYELFDELHEELTEKGKTMAVKEDTDMAGVRELRAQMNFEHCVLTVGDRLSFQDLTF